MKYYILGEKPIGNMTPMARIEDYENDIGVPDWYSGNLLEVDSDSILYCILDEATPGYLPHFFNETVPLMSNRLIAVLNSAGVDNLQTYKAILKLGDGEVISEEYKAVNIVGKIAAANLGESEFKSFDGSNMIDTDFDSLAIDDSVIQGMHLFRLAEAVSAIVIDETIKSALEDSDIELIGVNEPENWMG